jgi:hypothetical protein
VSLNQEDKDRQRSRAREKLTILVQGAQQNRLDIPSRQNHNLKHVPYTKLKVDK